MKIPQNINAQYLSELATKIQTLPPDEASILLLEASTIILLAGFPEIAYQGFLNLTQGELKLSESSSLGGILDTVFPALCYSIKRPCPAFLSQSAMTLEELEKKVCHNQSEYERVTGIDRWLMIDMPSGEWTEEFLSTITHPQVDIHSSARSEVTSFLQDLNRVISQYYVSKGKWQDSLKWFQVFEATVNAWEINCNGYIEQEIITLGIRTYLQLAHIFLR